MRSPAGQPVSFRYVITCARWTVGDALSSVREGHAAIALDTQTLTSQLNNHTISVDGF